MSRMDELSREEFVRGIDVRLQAFALHEVREDRTTRRHYATHWIETWRRSPHPELTPQEVEHTLATLTAFVNEVLPEHLT